jgi:putative transposase
MLFVYRGLFSLPMRDVYRNSNTAVRHVSPRLAQKRVNRGYQWYALPVSNIHRLRSSNKIFFITTNLISGEPHFAEPDYEIIIETIAKAQERLGFLLCGYVLMPDHWHVLIWPRFPITISSVVQTVKRVSSFKLNRLRHGRGPLWQHQFWDRFVRHTQEFRERLDYMHFNPVRKGLVKDPEHWRWSSYNNFSLDKCKVAKCPIQIDYVRLPEDYRA